ncbi:MAG: hypothetical protein DME24_12920 [Verrucomicrobia bacterium]|nr:MAG: hypothetical protein DME24_12920 [Verrucomicrobiota bacterium]
MPTVTLTRTASRLLARSDLTSQTPTHAYFHTDGNGNITALISDKQIIVAKYVYDPFGNTLSKSGPLADANLYRFSSQEYHPNSGLLLYLRRAYDPNLQRWLNRDPIDERGGINLFAYCRNNPVIFVDATGLDTGALGIAGNLGAGLNFAISGQITFSTRNDKPWAWRDWRFGFQGSIAPFTQAIAGLSAGLGIDIGYSPATRPEQWNGWSFGAGASGSYLGLGAGLDVSNLPKGPWKADLTIGPSFDLGIPIPVPAEVHAGAGYTTASSHSIQDALDELDEFSWQAFLWLSRCFK